MFAFLFSPHGRVSRSKMWFGLFLPQLVLSIASNAIDAAMFAATATGGADAVHAAPAGVVSLLLSLAYAWPNIVVPIKRFHDRGMSGWWVLWFALAILVGAVMAIPGLYHAAATQTAPGSVALLGMCVVVVATLAQFVILYCLGGQEGPNKYGPDPRTGSGRPAAAEASTASWADGLDPVALAAASRSAPVAAAPRAALEASKPRRTFAAAASFNDAERPAFGRRGLGAT